MKSAGNRSTLRCTARTSALVCTWYNAARSASSKTFCSRRTRIAFSIRSNGMMLSLVLIAPKRYKVDVTSIRDVSIERIDADVRVPDRDRVVVEAPLQLRARGVPVATIMRTPGHDLEIVRGLLHAESIAANIGAV